MNCQCIRKQTIVSCSHVWHSLMTGHSAGHCVIRGWHPSRADTKEELPPHIYRTFAVPKKRAVIYNLALAHATN